jgi:biotin--protein ligase
MLVMPGGADLPYCRHLNGAGNQLISNFVKVQGGAYLGLCAGAYYGCSRVEFEVGSEIEVVGDRELGFYPGTARGSIYPGFDYQSEKGARAAPLKFKKRNKSSSSSSTSSGNGCSNDNCSNGSGDILWEECRDYLNGGPGFLVPRNDNGDDWRGDGAATYLSLLTSSLLPQNIEILATFSDHKDAAAAAVVCQVGLGCAVLCATHPELLPEWLDLPAGGGRSDAVLSNGDSEKSTTYRITRAGAALKSRSKGLIGEGEEHVESRSLQRDLIEHEHGRWKFWQRLLIAAGLEDVLAE